MGFAGGVGRRGLFVQRRLLHPCPGPKASGISRVEHAKDAPNDTWTKFAVMGIIIISALAVLAAWCGACWPGHMPNLTLACPNL